MDSLPAAPLLTPPLLSPPERRRLAAQARSRNASAAEVKRARLLLLLDQGLGWQAICERLPCSPDYINRWKTRFAQTRLDGLRPRHRGRAPRRETPQIEAQVLALTRKTPPDGAARWSTRKLGAALGISHMQVKRIWEKHRAQPGAGTGADRSATDSTVTAERTAPPARRTQRERREATRRQLLDAGIDCVCELGFRGATTAAIAARAGVSRGAVQHHFATRGQLLLAILEDFRHKLVARPPRNPSAGQPIAERLDALLEQYWEIINSRHFIATVQIQLGTVNDRELYPAVFKSMHRSVTELDRGWVAIFAEHDVPPERVMAARHLALATFRGLAVRQVYRADGDGWRAERALLKEMLRNALTGGQAGDNRGGALQHN